MAKKKDIKINLDTYGNFLGMEKGCIVLRDKEGKESRYPLCEDIIGEIVLNSGNMISTGLLTSMAFWGIDILIATRIGRPVAMVKNLDDDCHVETRISQYRALKNGKGCYLAKKFVEGKIEGQNSLLVKYGLKTDDSIIQKVRGKILSPIHKPKLPSSPLYSDTLSQHTLLRASPASGLAPLAWRPDVLNLYRARWFKKSIIVP